jgi:hypothetical protein
MDLNKTNFSHFAPPKDPKAAAESAKTGGDHKSAWEKHHRTALDQGTATRLPRTPRRFRTPQSRTRARCRTTPE